MSKNIDITRAVTVIKN